MNNKFVLIIDDEPCIHEPLSELMQLEGHQVQVAENGEIAFQLLTHTQHLPDVILLDLMMPICSGYDFLPRMLAQNSLASIPVIIISAAQDAGDFAKQYGSQYMKKPLDADSLLKAVQESAPKH